MSEHPNPTGPTDPTGPADESDRPQEHHDWQASYDATPLRDVPFETMSGVPVDPVYGNGPMPGQYPFTRGLYAAGYRSRLWTMRMFAGFGTAEDTNARFKEILANGGTGLSTAFDMPTLMGYDSDSSWALGEVGRAGVAVDTLRDMEDLYADIDLGSVSTSMTVNGPAATLLAMYIAVGEQNGVAKADLAGTIQNDILKEYQAQKEYIYPPRPSMRIVTDMIRYTSTEMPKWHPVSISGYHIREAGSTAAQELAFTLANGFAYVEAALADGQDVNHFGRRLSFFFNAHSDFFEEIGKFRAARRIWARWMKERYGATDERAMMCRFHTQTAGVSLTAQQPENNIARVAMQALSAALGGTQSLHTDAYDEALALPSEPAARIALRTQQIVAHETGVTNVVDPLGGAPYVEWMTDEMERQAEAVFAHLDELGNGSILEGVYEGIDKGYFVGEIANAAYRFEREINAHRRITVGVNDFVEGNGEGDTNLLRIDGSVEELQRKRLAMIKQERNDTAVSEALAAVRNAAEEPTTNLMPPIIDAVTTYATEEEIAHALRDVFGTYVEQVIV